MICARTPQCTALQDLLALALFCSSHSVALATEHHRNLCLAPTLVTATLPRNHRFGSALGDSLPRPASRPHRTQHVRSIPAHPGSCPLQLQPPHVGVPYAEHPRTPWLAPTSVSALVPGYHLYREDCPGQWPPQLWPSHQGSTSTEDPSIPGPCQAKLQVNESHQAHTVCTGDNHTYT